MQIIYIFLIRLLTRLYMHYKHNKRPLSCTIFYSKAGENRSQNIVNYILIMAWLCADAGYILTAEEKLGWEEGSVWCPGAHWYPGLVPFFPVFSVSKSDCYLCFLPSVTSRSSFATFGKSAGGLVISKRQKWKEGVELDANYHGCPDSGQREPFYSFTQGSWSELQNLSHKPKTHTHTTTNILILVRP